MDDKNRHLSEKEILDITKNAMNKTFGDYGLGSSYKSKNKGGLGNFVEENIFQYSANSDDEPDFIDAEIELKVTPIKQNQNGSFSSKERLVLNIINYEKEGDKDFETSSFYHKNKRLLIWFYLYSKGINPASFPITNYELVDFNTSEIKNTPNYQVIKRDWEIIHEKINKGLAHTISESDTTFLSACRKGTKGTKPRKQFQGKGPDALQRAYSFKNGFMTRLYRELLHEVAPYVSFISDDEWTKNTLEKLYEDKLSVYHNKSVKELKTKFNIINNPKDVCFRIAQGMLGLKGKDSSTQEMEDAGIKLKTVRLQQNGTPHESMSFPAFDFTELINKEWEESDIREDFIDWKLMLFIFQDDEKGVCRFDKVLFWNIPNNLVDGEIKDMYYECVKLVKSGNVIKQVTVDSNGKEKVIDYFPKESEKRGGNGVCHVRPHGRDSKDVFELPVHDKLTNRTTYSKQGFWFNKLYIKKIIKELNKAEDNPSQLNFDLLG